MSDTASQTVGRGAVENDIVHGKVTGIAPEGSPKMNFNAASLILFFDTSNIDGGSQKPGFAIARPNESGSYQFGVKELHGQKLPNGAKCVLHFPAVVSDAKADFVIQIPASVAFIRALEPKTIDASYASAVAVPTTGGDGTSQTPVATEIKRLQKVLDDFEASLQSTLALFVRNDVDARQKRSLINFRLDTLSNERVLLKKLLDELTSQNAAESLRIAGETHDSNVPTYKAAIALRPAP